MINVQFLPSTQAELSEPIVPPRNKPAFDDQILKLDYRERKLRFAAGPNWLRIVPAIQPSVHSWMMGLRILNYGAGQFVHPRLLDRRKRSVFDVAYGWMKCHHPEALYSKENRNGARLLASPYKLCWVIAETEDKPVDRLFCAGGYDGNRGGNPGLGYLIEKAAREATAVNADAGCKLCVIKKQTDKYPSYQIEVDRTPAPITELLSQMDDEEANALCPLENTVRLLNEEEQWQCLEAYMAKDTVAQIRADLGR